MRAARAGYPGAALRQFGALLTERVEGSGIARVGVAGFRVELVGEPIYDQRLDVMRR